MIHTIRVLLLSFLFTAFVCAGAEAELAKLRYGHSLTVVVPLSELNPAREQAVRDELRLAKYKPEMERVLKENILGFWYPKSLDKEHGGYIINFGPNGEAKGPGTKMIVTQSRMVWLFARAARAGHGDRKQLLDAAEVGYRFLKDKMWDVKHGGFYWEVDPTGKEILNSQKQLYGESFGLYALSEYYLATQRKDVLALAVKLFNLMELKAHDKQYGGYREAFQADWTPLPAGQSSPMGPAEFKLMNTHLHLLEAMTTFYRASKLPLARERLLELIQIQSNSVVRKQLGACTDKYKQDWTPVLDGNYARVSYGHDIENVWLLMDASEAAGISNYPLLNLYKTLFSYSRLYGFDEKAGGFYDSGVFNQPADRRQKVWWVEAEALVSALRMFRMTHDRQYLEVFEKTWGFVSKRMVDSKSGEWHSEITPEGKAVGDKANAWKAGYHNGRSMIECLRMLE